MNEDNVLFQNLRGEKHFKPGPRNRFFVPLLAVLVKIPDHHPVVFV